MIRHSNQNQYLYESYHICMHLNSKLYSNFGQIDFTIFDLLRSSWTASFCEHCEPHLDQLPTVFVFLQLFDETELWSWSSLYLYWQGMTSPAHLLQIFKSSPKLLWLFPTTGAKLQYFSVLTTECFMFCFRLVVGTSAQFMLSCVHLSQETIGLKAWGLQF